MSFKKIISAVLLSAFVTATFAGCSNSDTQTADEATTVKISSSSTSSNADDSSTDDEMFTAKDKEIGYDESECETITLSDNASTSSLKSVKIDGNTITVSEEGTYIVSGTLSDGQIIIDGDKNEKIRLILDGVTINSNTGAPIYVKQTDKLFITLAENSKNVLTNNKKFTADGDNNVDAVIFSKDDITLNGNGSLEITTNCGHGIVSKDDLKITSGTYSITSSSHALDGKDSVRIASGTFTLNSDKDGIHSENVDDTSLGFIYIAGGTFRIASDGDGMDASAYLTILDCNATIKSGGGASNAEKNRKNSAEWKMLHQAQTAIPQAQRVLRQAEISQFRAVHSALTVQMTLFIQTLISAFQTAILQLQRVMTVFMPTAVLKFRAVQSM